MFLLSEMVFSETNPIYVNQEGQVGFGVEEGEVIPEGVDTLLKGTTKIGGDFLLPVLSKAPENPVDGMVFIHTSGEMRYFVGGSWFRMSKDVVAANLQVESGVISCSTDFQSIALTKSFMSPIIITTPVSTIANAPIVVRLDQVSGSGFDIKLQRIDGSVEPLAAPLTVHYIVIEEGVYNLDEHGVKLEARKVDSTVTDKSNSWVGEVMNYEQTYSSPVVLGQVMTYNNSEFSQFWCRGSSFGSPPTASALSVGKHTFAATQTLLPETLGVLIIEAGSGEMDGQSFHTGVGADIVLGTQNNGDYNYDMPFSASVGVVSQVAMDGGDGGIATFKENPVAQSTLKILVDECTITDTERAHTSEQVSFLILE